MPQFYGNESLTHYFICYMTEKFDDLEEQEREQFEEHDMYSPNTVKMYCDSLMDCMNVPDGMFRSAILNSVDWNGVYSEVKAYIEQAHHDQETKIDSAGDSDTESRQ